MTLKPTRRGVLAGMAGGAVTVTLHPSTSAAALVTGAVDPLVALEAEFLQADADFNAANLAVDRAEGEGWLGQPHYVPMPAVMAGDYECSSEAFVRGCCQPDDPDGPSEAERDRLIAELRRRQGPYRDARERAGFAGLDKRRSPRPTRGTMHCWSG